MFSFHKMVLHVKCLTVYLKRDLDHQAQGLGEAKCCCGQTFNYMSDKDWDTKLQMHCKVCPRPVESCKFIRVPKKTMMLTELQHDEIKRMRRVHKHN